VRLVLDTNTIGSLWRGPPHALLQAVRERRELLVHSSPKLLAELADVLAREAIRRRALVELREAMDRMAAVESAMMTPEEIQAEIKAARARLVLDTNTVVSGLLWDNTPSQLIAAGLQGRVELFTSQALLLELEDVLQREKFAGRCTEAD
jgi:predicted nucleic acid-binding protein